MIPFAAIDVMSDSLRPSTDVFFELLDNNQELEFASVHDDVRLDVIHGFLPT